MPRPKKPEEKTGGAGSTFGYGGSTNEPAELPAHTGPVPEIDPIATEFEPAVTVPCATEGCTLDTHTGDHRAADGAWFNFGREIPPHVYGEDAVFDDAIKAIIAGRDLDARRGEADHRALTHAEVAASDAGYTREPDGMAAWHLACLIRAEIPADLDTPEANRVRQAQADLNAAALSRLTPRILMDTPDAPAIVLSLKDRATAVLSDGELALHVHRAIKAGHVRFATPWKLEGTARYVRHDAITGAQLAELSRTVVGQLGRSPTAPRAPDLYRVRVAGFDEPADMELDAGKAWVAARLAVRDIRDA